MDILRRFKGKRGYEKLWLFYAREGIKFALLKIMRAGSMSLLSPLFWRQKKKPLKFEEIISGGYGQSLLYLSGKISLSIFLAVRV